MRQRGCRAMRFRLTDLFSVFVLVVLIGAVAIASQWVLRASIIILVLGGVGIVLMTAQLLLDIFGREVVSAAPEVPKFELPIIQDTDPKSTLRGTLEIWGWMVGLVLAVPIVGLAVGLPLFVLTYTKFYGASWRLSLILSGFIAAFIFGVYVQIMHVYWPDSLLGDLLGWEE
jgi:hypothetical protein